MKGGVGFTGQSPSAACRSVWHTPEASILTRIWPGPTSGTGTSSIDSGFVNSCTTAAFMVFAIITSPSAALALYSPLVLTRPAAGCH